MSKKLIAFLTLGFLTIMNAGCSESASTGAIVDIPAIHMNCTSANCLAYAGPTPRMIAFITTSGCTSPAFGTIRSTSTNSITCTVGVGCSGFLTGWIDSSAATTTTMPSGTYSICVIVDYNSNNATGLPEAGDSYGELNNIAVANGTGTQFVTSFTDY